MLSEVSEHQRKSIKYLWAGCLHCVRAVAEMIDGGPSIQGGDLLSGRQKVPPDHISYMIAGLGGTFFLGYPVQGGGQIGAVKSCDTSPPRLVLLVQGVYHLSTVYHFYM